MSRFVSDISTDNEFKYFNTFFSIVPYTTDNVASTFPILVQFLKLLFINNGKNSH